MTEDLKKRLNPGLLGITAYQAGTSVQEARRILGKRSWSKSGSFVKMASNENPLGISPRAARAVRAVLKQSSQYPEVGRYDLRQAVSKKLQVPPGCLGIGNGGDGILYSLAMTLLERGLIVRFGFAGALSTYVRITPGTRRQNLRLIKALKEAWK